MSTIKYNRVKKMSALGKFGGTFNALWMAIPQSSIDALTSNQLVTLISAIWETWEKTKDIVKKEVDTFDTYSRLGTDKNNCVALFKDGVYKIRTEYVCKDWSDYSVGLSS